jgi:hypothetical protein
MAKNYAKTNIRIPQIARYRVAGITDKKIADLMGMTYQALAQLMLTQDYKDEEQSILSGQITKLDEQMAGRANLLKAEMRRAVPCAVRGLIDAVNQRRDLKACLTAAKEILDRDPDKTLRVDEDSAPKEELPAEVLEAMVSQANKVADSYQKQVEDTTKAKVN